ncbi:Hypothetical predicted protein [Olea europaea subsp. europaea]|uniref:Uncharacterized protein n=1 Tax=Olea europaea subsp. europaea TaxID=158383 RepID=A0A8S0PE86_OLEEU|nr:Hypothetical predicted protein [Olea europaea subsp. europaea]
MIGTVGVPMITIEAQLEPVPEMGYDALSKDVVANGWFHTDLGLWKQLRAVTCGCGGTRERSTRRLGCK